jgi:hypothetical protein
VDVGGGIQTGLSHQINCKLLGNKKELSLASLHVTGVASTTADAASEMRTTTRRMLNVVGRPRTN